MKKRRVCLGAVGLVAGAALFAAGYKLGSAPRAEQAPTMRPQKAYVVMEFAWRWRSNRAPEILDDKRPGTPVAVFLERAHADARCRELQLQRRAKENPFRYLPAGGEYSSTGKTGFMAFVRSQGLTPPADYPGGEDDLAWAWWEWWEAHAGKWDNGFVNRFWEVLDRVQFYEVVEVPSGR